MKEKLFSLSGRPGRAFPFPSLAAARGELGSAGTLIPPRADIPLFQSFSVLPQTHVTLSRPDCFQNSSGFLGKMYGTALGGCWEVGRDGELHFNLKGAV